MCDHAFEWAGKQKGFLRVSQIHGESEIFAIVDDTWTLSEEKGEIQQEHMRFDAEARLLVKPCMHSIAVQNPYLALSSYSYHGGGVQDTEMNFIMENDDLPDFTQSATDLFAHGQEISGAGNGSAEDNGLKTASSSFKFLACLVLVFFFARLLGQHEVKRTSVAGLSGACTRSGP